jgi:hypothetical protein
MSGTAAFPDSGGTPLFGWSTRLGAALSFAAPFAVALLHAGTASIWRDDLVVLRGVGWVGLGQSGCLSALLAQASLLVPLGSAHFRLAFAAAIVLGAAGVIVHDYTRDLLARRANVPLLDEALATIAALTATLSATAQHQGAVAGGGGVALLLALLVLRAGPAEALRYPRTAIRVGILVGALFAENAWTALALGVALLLGLATEKHRVNSRGASFLVGAAVVTAAVLVSPVWLRNLGHGSYLDIDRAVAAMPPPAAARSQGVIAHLAPDAPILLIAGAVGLTLGLVERRLRGAVVPLGVLVALGAGAALGETRLLRAEEVAPLRLVVGAALAVGVALCLQAVAVALLAWRLPMAKGAAILLVMTDLTLAVAAAEEASYANDPSALRGAEAFTDEALELLPPEAALFVRSRATAWRLWAAQLAHGTRPDVLVVPMPAIGDTRLSLRLLRAEPALHKALQDIVLEGRPGEEALTILADVRPVFVELDPAWDRRVYSHFVPDRFWLRFAPEPRGPSDRRASFADLRACADRVLATGVAGDVLDAETSAIVRAQLIDGAVVAALLGDRDEAAALAARIGAVAGGELFAAELMQKLLATKSGPVDAKSLLR